MLFLYIQDTALGTTVQRRQHDVLLYRAAEHQTVVLTAFGRHYNIVLNGIAYTADFDLLTF